MWQLDFKIVYKNITYIEEFVNFIGDSVSFSSTKSTTIDININEIWQVSIYFNNEPNFIGIIRQLNKLLLIHDITITGLTHYKIPILDWVSLVQEKFTPLSVGRFFISSKFYSHLAPSDQVPIIIDAACAFGTGEHATTRSCIESLEHLAVNKFNNILDMGTGSGILAIAASHIWPTAEVFGCDIDQVAIPIAIDNALNNTTQSINFFHSNGYDNIIFTSLNFDLIISNILAAPLISLASDTAAKCRVNGFIILSGFLHNQADEVITTYQQFNFRVIKKISYDDSLNEWVTIIMQLLKR